MFPSEETQSSYDRRSYTSEYFNKGLDKHNSKYSETVNINEEYEIFNDSPPASNGLTKKNNYQTSPSPSFNYKINMTPSMSTGPIISQNGNISEDYPSNQSSDDEDYDDELLNALTSVPVMDKLRYDPQVKYQLEVQTTANKTFFNIEVIGCFISSILVCSVSFMFTLSYNYTDNTDVIFRYITNRFLYFVMIGGASHVLTTADTYKSINITVCTLGINCIVYNYNAQTVLKYLAIQIVCTIIGSFFTFSIFFQLLDKISTENVLRNILATSREYNFNFSFISVNILAHIFNSVGTTAIINLTNSVNAKNKVVERMFYSFIVSIVFGLAVGPIGYVQYNIGLYFAVCVIRNDYEYFDVSAFMTYLITIIIILFIYPLLAIQTKYKWRNIYRNYLEYEESPKT